MYLTFKVHDMDTLRWGKTIFDCRFCGSESMQWKEIAPDKWRPFDLLKNELHTCSENVLTQDELLGHLLGMGFSVVTPKTSSWQFAYIVSNKTSTIYFLIGKRGIDFKYYDYLKEIVVENGKLNTSGGYLVRNNYADSAVNVNRLIFDIASRIVGDAPLEESWFSGTGRSWKERKEEYFREHATPEVAARDEMMDIYNACSPGDGSDAYLGDGIWITPDGRTEDRGR